MKDTLINKQGSFKVSLAVADDPIHLPIWTNRPPLAFAEGIAAVRSKVSALDSAAALQSQGTNGTSNVLRQLREQFNDDLHVMARALYQYFKNAGRLEDAAKCDWSPSDLHNSRANSLAGLGETVLDLAEPLVEGAGTGTAEQAAKYGITAESVNSLDGLWSRYSTMVGAPKGARSKRKALTNSLPGQFAALETEFAGLDDLILQFNKTEAGQRFVDAWFNARRVVEMGRRAAKSAPAAEPAAPAK